MVIHKRVVKLPMHILGSFEETLLTMTISENVHVIKGDHFRLHPLK